MKTRMPMKKILASVLCVGLLASGVSAAVSGQNKKNAEDEVRARNNVIFFHTDGYGLSHWDALRTKSVGPDGILNWDKLPYSAGYTGHMKDQLTGTSHGGATTHAYGVKVAADSFGLDGETPITALSGKQMSIIPIKKYGAVPK